MVDKKSISDAVKAQVKLLYGDRLAKLILYGSYARGDYNEESDIDFLVVLKDDKIEVGKEIIQLSQGLSALNLDFDVVISKYPTTAQNYQNSALSFFKNVRRDGIEI